MNLIRGENFQGQENSGLNIVGKSDNIGTPLDDDRTNDWLDLDSLKPTPEETTIKSQPVKAELNDSGNSAKSEQTKQPEKMDDLIEKIKEINPDFADKSEDEILDLFKNANKKINEQAIKIKELEKLAGEIDNDDPKAKEKRENLKSKLDEQKKKREQLINELKEGIALYSDDDFSKKFAKTLDALTDNSSVEEYETKIAELTKTISEIQKENEARKKQEQIKIEAEANQKMIYDISKEVITAASTKFESQEILEAKQLLQSDYAKELYLPLIESALKTKDKAQIKKMYNQIFENAIYTLRGKAMPELIKQIKSQTAKSVMQNNAATGVSTNNADTATKKFKFLNRC